MATSEYLTALLDPLAAYLSDIAATANGVDLPKEAITNFLRMYKSNNALEPIKLSSVRPDFEQIIRQGQAYLEAKKSWNEIITAGGGQTLLEFVGAVGTLCQFSIQRALQENFLDTAQAPSSVYLRMLSLGVRLMRKRPAQVLVRFSNGDGTIGASIPAFTQFEINGVPFFNRYPIAFPAGQPILLDIPLYQGRIQTANFTSNGQAFQKFELGDDDFAVSNDDVAVFIGSELDPWTRVEDGLWNYDGAAKVFYDRTTQYGNVECEFGSGILGASIASGTSINFVYAVTTGFSGNIAQSALAVTCAQFPNILGTTTSHALGGENEKTPEFYRSVGASIFAARGRAVTAEDFEAHSLLYPGVVDVKFLGQRDINPDLVTRMNVVSITMITNLPWSASQKTAYRQYIEKLSVLSLNFMLDEPEEVVVDIEADVYCAYGIDLIAAKNYLTNQINSKFQLKRGSLGFSWYKSDIIDVLRDSTFKVDYVLLKNPTTDRVIGKKTYLTLGAVTINTFYGTREG